jgi:hypothetical protein
MDQCLFESFKFAMNLQGVYNHVRPNMALDGYMSQQHLTMNYRPDRVYEKRRTQGKIMNARRMHVNN